MNFDKYENPLPYPGIKPRTPALPTKKPTVEQLTEYGKKVMEFSKTLEKWEVAIKAWRKKDRELLDIFFEDALEELGLKGHIKAQQLCNLARRNNTALTDIFYEMEELAVLLSPPAEQDAGPEEEDGEWAEGWEDRTGKK